MVNDSGMNSQGSEPKPTAKKIPTPKGGYLRYWWWGGDRVKRLVVQEVRAADNTYGMMGITAKNQAVFVFLSVGLAQSIIEFSSGFTL